MKYKFNSKLGLPIVIAATCLFTACNEDDNNGVDIPASELELKDYSVNPSLVKTLAGFEGVKINTLISSDALINT